MPTTPKPTPAPHGGYSLPAVRKAGGEETLRWQACLTKDGKKVVHVSNDGYGGSDRCGLAGGRTAVTDPLQAHAEHRAAMQEFEAFATARNAGHRARVSRPATSSSDGCSTSTGSTACAWCRSSSTATNPWHGDVWTLRGASREETLATLGTPAYAARQSKVWSRTAGTSSRRSDRKGRARGESPGCDDDVRGEQ